MARDYDPEIAWYICEAPGLLGEQSSHGSVVASIQAGGGFTIASSDGYHSAIIDRLHHVARARRCDKVWSRMSAYSRLILRGRYHARTVWPLATDTHLGTDLVGVALATAKDRTTLLQACLSAANKKSKVIIKTSREAALADVIRAHIEWQDIWRSMPPILSETQRRVDRFAQELGI